MRVLWFAVTPSMYAQNNTSHNGGGWIASLEALMRDVPNVKLGIAFEHSDTFFKVEREGTIYYPINVWKSMWKKLKRKFIYETEEKVIIPACLKVIDDFKPDVIHIFGSEWCFGLVAQHTNIPVVIHLQGSIPPYYNARFPPGYNMYDYIFYNGINIKRTFDQLLTDRFFKLRAKREERILRLCRYYMGRTEWDHGLVRLYAPDAQYFYCSEALRVSFLKTDTIWKTHIRDRYIFVTTISSPLYKGSDVILKTAQLLMQNTSFNFEWRIFGIKELKLQEIKTKIKASDVNVKLMGTVSSDVLKDELLTADIFIHPSYIDNSPNSVCEAQLLGMPVISTNVGGISSLVKHHETGLLVSSNDPYSIASNIILMLTEKNIAASMGRRARETALERHDPKQILSDLIGVYNSVVAYE